MEDRLSQMPDCGMEEQPLDRITVAKTTMAFANSEVIKLLQARGTAIKGEQWDKQT